MSYWAQLGMQNAANTTMECIIHFHDYMMMILSMILIFVVYFLFNILNQNLLDKETLESHSLELIWTVFPMLILIFMAYPSLTMLYFMEASENSNVDMSLKIIAHQWYWEYENSNSLLVETMFHMGHNTMAEGSLLEVSSFDSSLSATPKIFYTLESTNSLNLPLSKMIFAYVTSADVMHAFTVPSFGVKVDAIPGRINTLSFILNTPGVFYGQCSEICGANHSFMPIHISVS